MIKKIISIIATFILITQLNACSAVEPVRVNIENEDSIFSNNLGELVKIGGLLWYDTATRIVYRMNDHAYGVTYVPYYASNGLPYRYDPSNNTFEEIKD